MTDNRRSTRFILPAALRIYDELPKLISPEAWQSLKPQVDAHIATLTEQPDNDLASTQIVTLLWPYPDAHRRLNQELDIQLNVTGGLSTPLAELKLVSNDAALAALLAGLSWEVDPDSVTSADERPEATRAISIKDGGVAGGWSIRFRNLDLDLGKMMTVGAGFLLAGQSMLEKQTPFVIAAGILLIVGTAVSEMTVKIEQQEATVFWGFIVATNHRPKDRQTTTDAIFTTTNTERTNRGLPGLTNEQFRNSLFKLEQLGSIAHADGSTYRIVERFKVKR